MKTVLWLYRKWKHDALISCIESAGCGLAACETYMERATMMKAVEANNKRRVRLSNAKTKQNANAKKEKRERNAWSEWERIMNKLKWTVMLILPLEATFATLVPLLTQNSFIYSKNSKSGEIKSIFFSRRFSKLNNFRGWNWMGREMERVIKRVRGWMFPSAIKCIRVCPNCCRVDCWLAAHFPWPFASSWNN